MACEGDLWLTVCVEFHRIFGEDLLGGRKSHSSRSFEVKYLRSDIFAISSTFSTYLFEF